jgi:TM2 domain-containing membrane protein YozV
MTSTALVRRDPRSVGLAYLLWLPCFFGISGLHRFYTGRWISGLVWLFTGGLCGIGQIVDLIFIPRMVEDHNEGRKIW